MDGNNCTMKDEDRRAGMVYLVGGGPGDPKLLTLRGVECLQSADVVVHDRLANSRLLSYAPSRAELIDVGKLPDRHPFPQEQINALLEGWTSELTCYVLA
jgi:uroporphyrin-III C-methyltransferase